MPIYEIISLRPLLIIGFDEDNILCFAGAEEGIFCTFQTILTDMVIFYVYKKLFQFQENVCMYVIVHYRLRYRRTRHIM